MNSNYNRASVPVPFDGSDQQKLRNYHSHQWVVSDPTEPLVCNICDSKTSHVAATYPCGQEPPRKYFTPPTAGDRRTSPVLSGHIPRITLAQVVVLKQHDGHDMAFEAEYEDNGRVTAMVLTCEHDGIIELIKVEA